MQVLTKLFRKKERKRKREKGLKTVKRYFLNIRIICYFRRFFFSSGGGGGGYKQVTFSHNPITDSPEFYHFSNVSRWVTKNLCLTPVALHVFIYREQGQHFLIKHHVHSYILIIRLGKWASNEISRGHNIPKCQRFDIYYLSSYSEQMFPPSRK